jgi:hypothetical protein
LSTSEQKQIIDIYLRHHVDLAELHSDTTKEAFEAELGSLNLGGRTVAQLIKWVANHLHDLIAKAVTRRRRAARLRIADDEKVALAISALVEAAIVELGHDVKTAGDVTTITNNVHTALTLSESGAGDPNEGVLCSAVFSEMMALTSMSSKARRELKLHYEEAIEVEAASAAAVVEAEAGRPHGPSEVAPRATSESIAGTALGLLRGGSGATIVAGSGQAVHVAPEAAEADEAEGENLYGAKTFPKGTPDYVKKYLTGVLAKVRAKVTSDLRLPSALTITAPEPSSGRGGMVFEPPPAEKYCLPVVTVWDPANTGRSDLSIRCPHCVSNSTRDLWYFRRVVGLTSTE